MKKNLLLVIDMQNDFCRPDGALYVPHAENDVKRVSAFILNHEKAIDHILFTQDTHHYLDIAHPGFWKNAAGERPALYTNISFTDFKNEVWLPVTDKEAVGNYLAALEAQGEFPHVIWPEHCIVGSEGAAIVSELLEAGRQWSFSSGKTFQVISKGLNPLTEHFGALRANIPNKNDASTLLNEELKTIICDYENIIIAGEAKSHCVANTIKQIFELDEFKGNMLILDDCMSNVPGFEESAQEIYQMAANRGAQFISSSMLNRSLDFR
ncbi:isochorismatase family protein [Marinilabiliaceae bacterium JC017]|nr:isochorismatase family protein [Marinilabiliaceae bacterium JC017]